MKPPYRVQRLENGEWGTLTIAPGLAYARADYAWAKTIHPENELRIITPGDRVLDKETP